MKKYLQTNLKAYEDSAADYAVMAEQRLVHYQEMLGFFSRYLNQEQNVLECGPGNGVFASLVSNYVHSVTGVEFSHKMAAVAQSNAPGLKMITAEFLAHNFTERFDVIIGIQFIHLFKNPELAQVFQKFEELLTPGGLVLLTTTLHKHHHEGFQGKKSFQGEPIRYRKQFSAVSFKNMVQKYRFRLVEYSEIYPDVETQANAIGYIRTVLVKF